MSYFSDPTASMALGNINREFSNHVKKAKKLRKLYNAGKISASTLQNAQAEFTGLYRHVLDIVLEQEDDESEEKST